MGRSNEVGEKLGSYMNARPILCTEDVDRSYQDYFDILTKDSGELAKDDDQEQNVGNSKSP